MPILFRWLLYNGCYHFVGALLMTASLLVISEVFDKSRYLGQGMDMSLMMEYIGLKLPLLLADFMPIILLLSSSVLITRLSYNHELTAMRTAGLGGSKLLLPLLLLALIVACTTFAIGEWVTPNTNSRLDYIEKVHIQHKSAKGTEGIQWLKEERRFFRLQPIGSEAFHLVVFDVDNSGRWQQRIEAAYATFDGQYWHLSQVYISHPDGDGLSLEQKETMRLAATTGPDTAALPTPGNMKLLELDDYISHVRQAGLAAHPYIFALHHSLATPLACFIMVLLSAAFCVQLEGKRSGVARGLGLAIVFGAVFFVLNQTSSLLAAGEYLPAAYAAWLPDLFFGGFACFWLLQREGY
ncbi:MAG: LptF/LptG family permease [Mariprofundales bacterium]